MFPTSSWARRSLIIMVTWSSVSKLAMFRIFGSIADPLANHRTGETCTLTFKPRGWRGANAFEIRGTVSDPEGNSIWDIAGRESPIRHVVRDHKLTGAWQAGTLSSLPVAPAPTRLSTSTRNLAIRRKSTCSCGATARSPRHHST